MKREGVKYKNCAQCKKKDGLPSLTILIESLIKPFCNHFNKRVINMISCVFRKRVWFYIASNY